MRNVKPTKVIISAYRHGASGAANRAFFADLLSDLTLVEEISGFREVEGRFDGYHEHSVFCWIRPGQILEGIDALTDLAREYCQSAVLVIHGDDAAELVETDGRGRTAIVGRFQAVEAPLPGEDYTKADSTFYVVR